jgi:hypothetical protein
MNKFFFIFNRDFPFFFWIIDGWFCSHFSTTNGCVNYPLRFCSVYEILSFIRTSFDCFGSLDGPTHLFD